ncbi:hypothetical protein O3G_MSEX014109 [Manduca sexta]|uniref:Mediator of RNA polymerase II transcription subunit 13 n=1 Tax=Manduca sexta TaxID=7130 RepID=A0A921ZTW3_MANSE|nr:hypothetical protein O3G_MSEX014109 [Manduca sexta]
MGWRPAPRTARRVCAGVRGGVAQCGASLAALPVDRTLFEGTGGSSPARAEGSASPTPEHEPEPASAPQSSAALCDADESGPPALVLYLVEPPAAPADRARALHCLLRLAATTHTHLMHHNPLIKSNQMPFEPPMANGEDNDMMFLNVDMGDEDMADDNINDLLIGDMFNNMWAPNSPRRADDEPGGSPAPAHHPAHHHQAHEGQQEQVGTVLQQPLALGYLVSTAPLGAMPGWWWAGCGHLRDACPAFLKNALHLHSVHAADDFTSLTQRRDHNTHPLDSQTTTDVLRYVLEGYNALSWLALDGNTHDRLSCLPLHVQVLMQLYHTAAALG